MARCRDAYTGRIYRCNSAWSDWVRWVVLAVIVIAFLLLFFLCSCITARRRRRAGRTPFYGTGWAVGRTAPGHGVPTYNNNNQWAQPAPPYTPSNTGTPGQGGYYAPPPGAPPGENAGYYGNQHNGVELQQPQHAHNYNRGGEDVYAPPLGPPPGKKDDGIIR
ncbi:hypothetical protein EJ05DRAFT_474061 [Pseudovirgaria hyperparasitica]|uniref:Uncharacterized protein n=1 Tax=Pseudovirgaria hyperparasitica TaxID=470096 RepID=A0A6A6WF00_9PEZI|nr:uncharacterized protein EJ05DRAFT_474061 [Pseudovirgaria hyperparasitica]KAF2760157.1 hypothetical protein EJ05DRAFT_474061 [Pseudovirgaria hyperparasitica]